VVAFSCCPVCQTRVKLTIPKNKKASQKSWDQHTHIEIKGGYKETFLLTAAQLLEAEFQWLRLCAFDNCPTPIFAARNNREKYCSPEHGANARNRKLYDRKAAARLARSLESQEGTHAWQVKHAHANLVFGDAVPSKHKVNSRKKVLQKKKARR